MEIRTLLRANIRYKHGSFFSIIILTIIITMSLTAIFSVNDSCKKSINNLFDDTDSGDIVEYIMSERLTDELLEQVNSNANVERTAVYDAISTMKSEAGDRNTSNTWFMQKLRSNYKLFNEDLTAYLDQTPALKKGEIYIAVGTKSDFGSTIGSKITVTTIGGAYEFIVAGFVAEPCNGSNVIGWKQVFISDEDFDSIYNDCKAAEGESTADFKVLHIYKSADCTLDDETLKSELNASTGIVDNSVGTMSRADSTYYTTLFPDTVLNILLVFIILLFVIVLIVLVHSISTGIEMDYVNISVLKSQGFSGGKIRVVFLLQYLIAQLIGTAVGVLLSLPLIEILGGVFVPITATLFVPLISYAKVLLGIFAILAISAVCVLAVTRKVGRISPVRAMQSGRSEIYFDSRLNVPISKKWLSLSLAVRQFTSEKRRYIGTILISALLVFFMMSIMVLGNVMNSETALESMGSILSDVVYNFNTHTDNAQRAEIEEEIGAITPITRCLYLAGTYLSINNEEMYCVIYDNPEEMLGLTSGRAPIYDNEIVLTEILAEELGLKIGDTAIIGSSEKSEEYIITGLCQNSSDAGRVFTLSGDGAERLAVEYYVSAYINLEDRTKNEETAALLNERFDDILYARALSIEEETQMYQLAVDAMKAVIYIFSAVFTLVVVTMVCKKAFLREKTDTGIYKAIGFTSGRLRRQFALRFLAVAAIGSAIGSVLCLIFAGEMLSLLLRAIGISSFLVTFTAETVIVPIVVICGCVLLFSYVASRRIKTVEVRELITE